MCFAHYIEVVPQELSFSLDNTFDVIFGEQIVTWFISVDLNSADFWKKRFQSERR